MKKEGREGKGRKGESREVLKGKKQEKLKVVQLTDIERSPSTVLTERPRRW